MSLLVKMHISSEQQQQITLSSMCIYYCLKISFAYTINHEFININIVYLKTKGRYFFLDFLLALVIMKSAAEFVAILSRAANWFPCKPNSILFTCALPK